MKPADQILFNTIEPTEYDTYPVSILNIDLIKEEVIIEKGVSIVMEDENL